MVGGKGGMVSDYIKFVVGTLDLEKTPAPVVEAVTVKLGSLLGPS